MTVKEWLKKAATACLIAPIWVGQKVISALGFSYFVQGDIFDRLLEEKTRADFGAGKTLIFHTPNNLTRIRARTLLEKEPETIEWIDGFQPDAVLWDIGANIGLYSLYASRVHPSIKVIAVEPSIENTYLLNRNISENALQEQVVAFPFALSESSGLNLFKHRKIQLGGAINSFGVDYSFDGKSALFPHAYHMYGFRADDLATVFNIPQPNYIKIDVDGIEHLIVRGARRVLSDSRLKSVLIELNFDFAAQRDEVIQILKECGLKLKGFKHAEAFTVGEYSRTFNHIFERG